MDFVVENLKYYVMYRSSFRYRQMYVLFRIHFWSTRNQNFVMMCATSSGTHRWFVVEFAVKTVALALWCCELVFSVATNCCSSSRRRSTTIDEAPSMMPVAFAEAPRCDWVATVPTGFAFVSLMMCSALVMRSFVVRDRMRASSLGRWCSSEWFHFRNRPERRSSTIETCIECQERYQMNALNWRIPFAMQVAQMLAASDRHFGCC